MSRSTGLAKLGFLFVTGIGAISSANVGKPSIAVEPEHVFLVTGAGFSCRDFAEGRSTGSVAPSRAFFNKFELNWEAGAGELTVDRIKVTISSPGKEKPFIGFIEGRELDALLGVQSGRVAPGARIANDKCGLHVGGIGSTLETEGPVTASVDIELEGSTLDTSGQKKPVVLTTTAKAELF